MNAKSLLLIVAMLFLAACGSSKPANLGYNPGANPTQQLATAQAEAQKSGRRVLLIAGGDWCRWCHVLDEFLSDNEDVKAEMAADFVVVKVYVGDDNGNEEFFDRLPEADGYPHFWVITRAGGVKSIDTGPLESGDDGYDKDRFLAMLRASKG